MKDRCKYQYEIEGVYSCKRNTDAIGPCHGLCGRYEPASRDLPPNICKECLQHLTAEETLNQYEYERGILLQFLKDSLEKGFNRMGATFILGNYDY